jgi:hypothetical protein
MRYTEPKIVKIDKAISIIQRQNQHGLVKPSEDQIDLDFVSCSAAAYESDE